MMKEYAVIHQSVRCASEDNPSDMLVWVVSAASENDAFRKFAMWASTEPYTTRNLRLVDFSIHPIQSMIKED